MNGFHRKTDTPTNVVWWITKCWLEDTIETICNELEGFGLETLNASGILLSCDE